MAKYKVTRIWYIEANSCCEAIELSKPDYTKDHDEVHACKMDILDDLFETKGVNE